MIYPHSGEWGFFILKKFRKKRIKHYPFKKHKVIGAPMTAKRALSVEQIVKIIEFKCTPGSRAELAKKIFLLSFCMCGMNAKDIQVVNQVNTW